MVFFLIKWIITQYILCETEPTCVIGELNGVDGVHFKAQHLRKEELMLKY